MNAPLSAVIKYKYGFKSEISERLFLCKAKDFFRLG